MYVNQEKGGQIMSETINTNPPVHATVEITVDPKMSTAFMMITPPQNGGLDITMDKIKTAMYEKDISYGIYEDTIASALDNRRYNENLCIAQWTPPVDGVDGSIKYHFDKESVTAPVEDEHGTVDYKNLNIVKNTLQGTVIATISMPTEGEPGKDISGRPVPQHIGVPANVSLGNGTALSPDGTQILASIDGNLRYANGAFMVEEELIIRGDVDVSTGNLDFIGNITVHGNVDEGYELKSKKNIYIKGTVIGAKLTAEGDITIKQGIINSNIECKGNVKLGFCENTVINCDNTVESGTFVGGEVFAGVSILATGQKGQMMGGKYTALENIEAATIGSEGYAKTVITLGNNAVLNEEREAAKKKIEELEDKADQLGKILTTLTELAKAAKLPPEREQMKVEAMRSRFQIQGEVKRLKNRIVEIERVLQQHQSLSVSCRKEFYPGVVIKINSFLHQVNVLTPRSKATIGSEGIVFMPL